MQSPPRIRKLLHEYAYECCTYVEEVRAVNAKRIVVAIIMVSLGTVACSSTSANDVTSVEPDTAVADGLEEVAEDIVCIPECTDKNCGDDGCGGVC